MQHPALTIDHVTRRFGAVHAVHDASARFLPGTIHAVIGENGAGKSTLLGLVGGVSAPDEGTVLIHGRPLHPATPAEATRRGVGFVHQHFMLVEAFSALENIMLGNEHLRPFGRLDFVKARTAAHDAMRELDVELNLDAPVSSLSLGERQSLELLRVLARGATTILLDEPTAVLTPSQSTHLFASVRRLADRGACVVVVTHRLAEVVAHCDEVTVMRRGSVVMHSSIAQTTLHELTHAIMGAEPPPPLERPAAPSDAADALTLDGITIGTSPQGRASVESVTLHVPAGKIIGIAGVEGNGQTELVLAIAGLRKIDRGLLRLGEHDVTHDSAAKRRHAGLAVVHADRQRDGLLLDASVFDNLVLGDAGSKDEVSLVQRRIAKFGIVPADDSLPSRALSGGNQQKIVTARALDRELRAVVMAQPTRGVDLGAARAIHAAICDAAKAGAGVLIVSADLAELRAICHEVVVMHQGRIVARLPPETSEDTFGQAMLGAGAEGAP